jgi:hypothetical protein
MRRQLTDSKKVGPAYSSFSNHRYVLPFALVSLACRCSSDREPCERGSKRSFAEASSVAAVKTFAKATNSKIHVLYGIMVDFKV